MTWFSHFTTHQTFHFFWKLKCSFLICTLNVLKLSTWIEKVKQRGGTWESVWVSVDGHLQTPDPCLTPKIWPICKYGSYLHIYIFTYLHISFKTAGLSRVPVRISVKQTVQHSLFCLCCRRRESDRRMHLSEGCQCPQCTKHTPRNTRAQSTAFIWCTLCVLVDFYFYLSFF